MERRNRALAVGALVAALLLAIWLLGSRPASPPAVHPTPTAQEPNDAPLRHRLRVETTPVPAAAAPSRGTPRQSWITVRDLADGAPMPDLEFVGPIDTASSDDDVQRTVRTDRGGRMPDFGDDIRPTLVDSSSARVVGFTDEEQDGRNLWVARDARVRVALDLPTTTPPIDLNTLRVALRWIPGGSGGSLSTRSPTPEQWSQSWLSKHGLIGKRYRGTRSDDAAVFTATVPAIRGMALLVADKARVASSLGLRVQFAPPGEITRISAAIGRLRSIRGRVVMPDGFEFDPRRSLVNVFIKTIVNLEEADLHLESRLGQGVTGGADHGRESEAAMSYRTQAQLQDDGTFRVRFHHSGRATLRVQIPGCLPETVELGALTTSRDDLVVHLRRRGELPVIRLKTQEENFDGGGDVLLVDGDQAAGQSGLGPYPIDADGSFTALDIERGRAYFVLLRGDGDTKWDRDRSGWFRFNGQSTIDIETELANSRSELD